MHSPTINSHYLGDCFCKGYSAVIKKRWLAFQKKCYSLYFVIDAERGEVSNRFVKSIGVVNREPYNTKTLTHFEWDRAKHESRWTSCLRVAWDRPPAV